MDMPQHICSPINGHSVCFQFGAILNKAAMNVHAMLSLVEIPRRRMTRSYIRCVFSFLLYDLQSNI